MKNPKACTETMGTLLGYGSSLGYDFLSIFTLANSIGILQNQSRNETTTILNFYIYLRLVKAGARPQNLSKP
jgi:hypothetical protein